MKRKLEKALAVVLAIGSFLIFSGFTFNPSEPVDNEPIPNAVFEVLGSGSIKRDNLTQSNSKWFGENNTVYADGKWGVSNVTWNFNLMLTADKEIYKNVSNFKVTVEYFDYNANGTSAVNIVTNEIGSAAGTKKWHTINYTNTKTWKTASVVCSNVEIADDTKIVNATYPGNFAMIVGYAEVVLDDTTKYNGALLHKIVIEPISENSPAVFEVAENGSASETNLAQYYAGGYNDVHTVGNKTGYSRVQTNQPLAFTLTPSLYANKHKFKVAVEFFDLNEGIGDDEIWLKVEYGATDGTAKGFYMTPWTDSGTWKICEFVLDDFDSNNLTTVANANYKMNFRIITNDNEQTLPNSDETFKGILVHKISFTPIDEEYTYSLRDIHDAPSAVYSVSEANVTARNIDFLDSYNTDVNNIITYTDKSGATASGIPHTSVTTDTTAKQPLKMNIDRTKYKDVHNVNIKIKWLDENHTNDDSWKRVQLIYPTYGGSDPTGVNIEATQSKKTGLWQETVYTASNIDFTKDCGTGWQTGANMIFHLNSKFNDFGTPDDTSDDYQGLLISSIEIIPIADYTFSDLTFKNEDGDVVDSLTAGEKFYTDLTVTRFGGDSAKDVTLIVALFNSENKIEKIAHNTVSVDADGSRLLSTCFVNPEDVSGKYVKIFVWDEVDSMNALSNTLKCE